MWLEKLENVSSAILSPDPEKNFWQETDNFWVKMESTGVQYYGVWGQIGWNWGYTDQSTRLRIDWLCSVLALVLLDHIYQYEITLIYFPVHDNYFSPLWSEETELGRDGQCSWPFHVVTHVSRPRFSGFADTKQGEWYQTNNWKEKQTEGGEILVRVKAVRHKECRQQALNNIWALASLTRSLAAWTISPCSFPVSSPFFYAL